MFGLGLGRMGLVGDLGFAIRRALFGDGEQGLWYDLNDDSTIFQDSAGTTLATWGDPVGLVLDKHESDGRGVVNRLIHTNDVTQAVWTASLQITRPSANVIVETVVVDAHALAQTTSFTAGITYTQSVSLQKGTLATAPDVMQLTFGSAAFGTSQFATVNVVTGAVLNTAGGATCTALGADPDYAGAWRFSYTATATSTATTSALGVVFCQNNPTNTRVPSYAGSTTADCRVYKCQSQTGSTATAYQANGASVGGAGNHAIQATSGSRPIRGRMPKRGRVNLVAPSENFADASWTKTNCSITSGVVTTSATSDGLSRTLTNYNANTSHAWTFRVSTGTATWLRFVCFHTTASTNRVTGWFDLAGGVVGSATNGGTGTGAAISAIEVSAGVYDVTLTGAVNNSAANVTIQISTATADLSTTGVSGVTYTPVRTQLEQSATATAYQHVIDSLGFNVTEVGQPSCGYLSYNGSNQWMQTAASVNFSATDEMSVFAGVRKVSDAARGIIVEFGNGAGGLTFYTLDAPNTGSQQRFAAKTVTGAQANALGASVTAPANFVLTGLTDTAVPVTTLRRNGVEDATSATDPGGNFDSQVIYFGARIGVTIFFNGLMFSTIIRGALTSGTLLTRTEQYVARQTPTVNL